MEKKTYAANYVPQCNMTGISGRQLRAGETYPANHFLNIDEHIAAGHIIDEDTHNKNVETAKKLAEEKEKGEPAAAVAPVILPKPEEKKEEKKQ